MAIFDLTVTKEILRVTCQILKQNFFYSDEVIGDFLECFTEVTGKELDNFEYFADPKVLDELHRDSLSRMHFTCYFISAHLREILIHRFNFSEQELYAFENILPKYTGERRHEKPKRERTHYRKFFE